MNLGIYRRQLLCQDGSPRQVEDHPRDESLRGALDPATNWAWKGSQSHYDWMESHSPDAGFE